MISWIESNSTPAIAVIVFILCYSLAAAIFGGALMLSRRPIAAELKTISPVTLTPLAVLLGLLIAFLASRVWEEVGSASEYVAREVSSLSEAIRFADALPPEVRAKVRSGVKQHIEFVESQDWPAMAKRPPAPHVDSIGLAGAMSELLSFTPVQPNQQLAQQRAVAAMEQAFEARRNRIQLSQADIGPLQWSIIILLSTLILLTTAIIHLDRPAAMATALFFFSSAVGACLVLLLAYDLPFGPGGVTTTPAAYREILSD